MRPGSGGPSLTAPAPVDPCQLLALAAVSWRELRWVVPNVVRETSAWLNRARRIPDPPLRQDAVTSLLEERFNVQGAAVFATLPPRRSLTLLRLLSTYQVMVDFLDAASERPCADMIANGVQLHRALYEALDPGGPTSDYYRLHPWRNDGGYLRALVEACRRECLALPSFVAVRPYVLAEASRLSVCAINHELDARVRDTALRAWARARLGSTTECEWFELTAAATSSVTILALLSLAARPRCTERDLSATRSAYFPWISLASTMLDSYVDREADLASGAHSYVGHYPSAATAAERLGEIVARSVARARALPRGRRHALIAAGMAAMYLTEPDATRGRARQASRRILRRGGPLPLLQVPILRAWRRLWAAS